MNISQPVSSEITGISFSLYKPEEVRKISVKGLTEPDSFDQFGHPTKGGLYDPVLGACDSTDICGTCGLDKAGCPGHFGHIELPTPVINALFFEEALLLLRAKCFFCHGFRFSDRARALYIAKHKLLKAGLIVEAKDFEGLVNASNDDDDFFKQQKPIDEVEVIEAKVEEILEAAGETTYLKTTLSQKEGADFIKEVIRSSIGQNTCYGCKGVKVDIRHASYHKVFQVPLNRKKINAMLKLNKTLPNVFEQSSLSIQAKRDDSEGVATLDEAILKATDKFNSNMDKNGIDIEEDDEEESEKTKEIDETTSSAMLLTPLHVLHHLHLLFTNEPEICKLLYGGMTNDNTPDARMFLYEVVPVPPSKFRPAVPLDGEIRENPQSGHLSKILSTCRFLQEHTNSKYSNDLSKLIDGWIQLQRDVNSYIDSNRGNTAPMGKEVTAGIKQALEKKEGLFRKHMMGKRVNYAARSVISPDPNIETNEIGIPPVFATTLTFPEPVTHFNVKKLRDSVIRGPKVWPGATHVQHEDGTLTQLDALSTESRIALANQLLTPQDASSQSLQAGGPFVPRNLGVNKKVYRHIENGDVVLLNRQPTLHKPSIMAHKVRVLPGEKTIRMHYANCNTYNADFDGDEMNIHFPQNQVARAEAMLIANTDNQYLVPTNGDPLRGLIQDHVATGVLMTCKDTFFTREEYMQLLYGTLRPEDEPNMQGRIITLHPAVLKPKPLWTGKQVITTVLYNLTRGKVPLNLQSKCKVPARYWEGAAPEEALLIISQGEYCTGCLDKSQFGASAYGLVHTVYELYGASMAGKLLSVLGRLFTKYCQSRGFTCRMDDLGLTPDGDEWRRKLIDQSTDAGQQATVQYIGMEGREKYKDFQDGFIQRMEEVYHDDEKLQGLDATMKSKMNGITSSIINTCIPNGLYKKFPLNHMQTMTVSGAKGSNVNVSQISCLLGQQELEGRRVPLMASGKTLPSFQPFETSARAGGFIAGRFLTGIKPQEYFFHCMAGREGLIDTAVKTSRSGYLQRCLIKHLEGLRVHYDNTVRDIDGSILQFAYGEDGLDVTKQKHINQFSFAVDNFHALKNKHQIGQAINYLDGNSAMDYSKKAAKKPQKYDPTMSVFSPSKYFGSVSEKFYKDLENYISTNPDNVEWDGKDPNNPNHLSKRKFRALMNLKYMQSLAEPGEAVGLLAAQSVGEPSTQMTLNTFHFAGFGAKNVTLGIPRLREIVMTASRDIKTPSMTLKIKPEVTNVERDRFCKRATKLTLSEIVDEVEVVESFMNHGGQVTKQYKVELKLFPASEYGQEFEVTPQRVEASMVMFIKRLEYLISMELRRQGVNVNMSDFKDDEGIVNDDTIGIGRSDIVDDMKDDDNDDEDDEDDEENDNDASDAKRSNKKKQFTSYDDKENDSEGDDDMDAIDKEFDDNSDDSETEEDKSLKLISDIRKTIMNNTKYTTEFKFSPNTCYFHLTFPVSTKKILMAGLAEQACKQAIVRQIDQIHRVFPIENEASDDTDRYIATEGMNIYGMWDYNDLIEVDSIETNDIYAVLKVYGVEACRNAIKREVAAVFGVYGIEVDPRHLALIADYMTMEGDYKAFNRIGIKSCPSPFQKMSYETTVSFLTQAVLCQDQDTLTSPSAKIVLGKVVEGGTGSFSIHQPLTSSQNSRITA